MSSKRFWLRIASIILSVVFMGGSGFVLYRSYQRGTLERSLIAAEMAHAQGILALEHNDVALAFRSLDEADLRMNKALDEVAKQRQKSSHKGEQLNHLIAQEGRVFWLKTQVLRDRAFAQALKAGQPLPIARDALSGQIFRDPLAIPDAQIRQEVLSSLRRAALLLPTRGDIQDEALRIEVAIPSLQWPLIDTFSRNLLQQQPENRRALFMLARVEFEQPANGGDALRGETRPSHKRDRQRVVLALRYLERLKKRDTLLFWRTRHLEALARRWLRDDAARQAKIAEEQTQRREWANVLADAGENAKRTRQSPASFWEVRSALALQLLILEAVLDEPKSETEKIAEVLNSLVDFCARMATDKAPPAVLEQSALTALTAIQRVERRIPLLASQRQSHLEKVALLAEKVHRRQGATPRLYVGLAELIVEEANTAEARGESKRKAALDRQALEWLEKGLSAGRSAQWSALSLAPLHALLAELKLIRGDKRPALTAHLHELKEIGTRESHALAALIEGTLFQQEGRFDKARQSLERVLLGSDADLRRCANRLLTDVYRRLNEPDHALASLLLLEQASSRHQARTVREQLWMRAFPLDGEDLTLALVAAHLDSAKQKIERAVSQRREAAAVLHSIDSHEKAVQALLRKLSPRNHQAEQAVQKLALYQKETRALQAACRESASQARDVGASPDPLSFR